jgi:Flp pilus assembly pilin Flp
MLSDLYRRLRGLMVRKTESEEEKGQGMVEYALILVVIVILTVVGHQVNNVFSNISSALGT